MDIDLTYCVVNNDGRDYLLECLAAIERNHPAKLKSEVLVLDNFSTPEKHMIEMMTGGVVTLDYDNDGLSDVYFVNGSVIPSMEKESRGTSKAEGTNSQRIAR